MLLTSEDLKGIDFRSIQLEFEPDRLPFEFSQISISGPGDSSMNVVDAAQPAFVVSVTGNFSKRRILDGDRQMPL